MFFSSKSKEHKSVFGAVSENQAVTYRVFAPYARGVNMLVRKGDNSYFNFPLNSNGDGWFERTTSFSDCGVYFYHFEVFYDRSKKTLWRGDDLQDVSSGNADWQQTVYKSDFCVPEFASKGVIYQIFPDRFCKGDIEYTKVFEDRVEANWDDEPLYAMGHVGRVINKDYFGGNFVGIAQKLDYLCELGVSVIYLNPIFEAHSNHRYNTANYLVADPVLGTNEQFADLCKKAKEKGISIILDGVFSHTGADSIYFNKNHRYDSLGAYESTESPYYSWYKFNSHPDDYLSWWGFKSLPEVIESDPAYSEFITGVGGVIDYWMGLGASGFRLDVADELPDEFIKKIRTAVKRNGGMLYGEVWEDASNKVSYGEQRAFLYGEELDSVMNYPFKDYIIDFLKGWSGTSFINSVMQILENYPPQCVHSLMNLLSTHDTERIVTALAGEPSYSRGREWQAVQKMSHEQLIQGAKMLKLASTLQYTLPGVPSLYYGDEILTQGYRDPFNRKSFDWKKVEDKSAYELENDMLDWYKTLGKLRAVCPALESGEFIPVQYEKDFVTYLRVKGEDELFVVVNKGENPVEIWLLPGWREDKTLVGAIHKDGITTVAAGDVLIMGRGSWTDKF